jgi:hypothetical protein
VSNYEISPTAQLTEVLICQELHIGFTFARQLMYENCALLYEDHPGNYEVFHSVTDHYSAVPVEQTCYPFVVVIALFELLLPHSAILLHVLSFLTPCQ